MEFHQWYLKSIKEAKERNQRDSDKEAIYNKKYGEEEGILDILGDKNYNPNNDIEDDLFRLDDDGGIYIQETFNDGEDEEDDEWHVF